MRHQRTAFFVALFLGAVWIISGYGKVNNTADFVLLASRFDLPSWMSIWAYAIPTLELVIGSALILQVNRNRLALVSLVVLGIFTTLYLYGYLVKGIEDCGCFGSESFFDSSPLIVIGRNLILMAISGVLWTSTARQRPNHRISFNLLVAIAIAAAFLSGRSSITPDADTEPEAVSGLSDPFNVTGMRASDTALSGFMPADTSANVLVFAFSLNCPHCWDAVETVKAYRRSGTVDSIIGVTFGTLSELDTFSKDFDVDFPIRLVPLREMTTLTTTVPRIFVVKQGRVMATFTSPVMSFRTFNDHYPVGP